MAFSIEVALEYLRRARGQDRLAHAYLITGEDGRGREALAVGLIRMVNDCSGESLQSLSSEFVRLVRPESKSRRITVEQIRELEASLQMAAPRRKTKVAVVQEADRMGPQAENAFLKTLEEPPPNSLILLLTSQPEQLLETILSRCIRIPLRAIPQGQVVIREQALLIKRLETFFREDRESPSRALGLAAEFAKLLQAAKAAVSKEFEEALKEETATYQKRIEGDWLKQREHYYEARTASEYIEKRNMLVETLVMFLGDALRLQHGFEELDLPSSRETAAQLGRRLDARELNRRFAVVDRLRSLLATNTNEKLALDASFLQAFGGRD